MPAATYSYQGIARLSFDLFRNTPTPAGLFFAICACFFIALFFVSAGKNGGRQAACRVAGGIGYLCCVILTALTYSRGAWCALLAALLGLIIIFRPGAKHGVALVAVTLAVLCCVPKGGSRLASMVDVRSDRAITKRLALWRGACHIIREHPLAGTGFGGIGVEYQKYWQPFGEGHRYSTAVSLPLTLFAGCGAPVCALYVSGTLLLARFSLLLAKKRDSLLFAWISPSIICFSVANLFAAILDNIIVFPLLCMAALTLHFSFARLGARELFQGWPRLLAACLALPGLPFGVSWLTGRPVRISSYATAEYYPGVQAERMTPATGAGARERAIVWCDANDTQSVVRGARLGRLACAAGMDTLVVRCQAAAFGQPGAGRLARRFADGRPMLLCADGALAPSVHEKLAAETPPAGALTGTVYIVEKLDRIMPETNAPPRPKPGNATVFPVETASADALLFQSIMARQYHALFVRKPFPDYEEDLLEWLRSSPPPPPIPMTGNRPNKDKSRNAAHTMNRKGGKKTGGKSWPILESAGTKNITWCVQITIPCKNAKTNKSHGGNTKGQRRGQKRFPLGKSSAPHPSAFS